MTTSTVTYGAFSGVSSWTVPALTLPVASPTVNVTALGACGGISSLQVAGGGLAACQIPAASGTVIGFTIGHLAFPGNVGGLGAGASGGTGGTGGAGYSAGGAGGTGGTGYNGGYGGCGGGGSTAATLSGNLFIEAGGGGGGIFCSYTAIPGGGGNARAAGTPYIGMGGGGGYLGPGYGGGPGTTTTGGSNGTAGTNSPTGTGGAGGTGYPGGGSPGGCGGGGGGGGWGGGGGGGNSGGGGGGGSIVKTPGTSASYTAGYNVNANGSISFTYTTADPPLAPTLVSPTNGTFADLQNTNPVFEFTYQPGTDSGALKTWALRRTVSGGAGTYNYWTATGTGSGNWTSTTRVENPDYYLTVVSGTPGSGPVTYGYQFYPGEWTDGNGYDWSFATTESYYPGTNLGPFATDILVIAAVAPVVAITGPSSVTTAPFNITWADTLGGSTQNTYRVMIYSAAQIASTGFTPGTTHGVFDSGVVTSTATSLSIALTDPSPRLISGDTYYPYVIITNYYSVPSLWASSSFPVAYPGPDTPALSAQVSLDPVSGQPLVNLIVTADATGITPTTFNFQYTDDFFDWYTVRGAGAVNASTLHASVQDREVAPSTDHGRLYRVQGVGYNSSVMEFIGGNWSPIGAAQIDTGGQVFISDPTTPGSAIGGVLSGNPSLNIHEVFTRYYPIGRNFGVKSTEGSKGFIGSIDFVTLTTADRMKLAALLARPITFLVQFPREAYYFTTDGDISTVVTWETMAQSNVDGYSLAVTKIPMAQASRP